MNDGPIVRRISFDIHGEFITQLAREWFYTGEKSHEKVIDILEHRRSFRKHSRR